MITKITVVMILNIILSIIIGFILIPLLKHNAYQRLNRYVEEHKSKIGTPTFGGLIFIIPVVITSLFLKPSSTLFIVIITFILYGLIGFIDDYLIVKRNNNDGLSEKSKFLLQLIVAIIFFYLFLRSGNEPLLWIHTLGIKINIGFLYGLFILLILVSTTNAVNITDGMDGLCGSLSFIVFITLGIITLNTGWLQGYIEVALICFSIVGSLIGFLFFNYNPAKIFMGDTGSLALGSLMGSVAILTRHELLLVVICIVFVIETLTCIIQRIYYKLTHKRLFLMTPIHHTFERIGYSENDIVRIFSLVGILFSLIALIFGVVL